MMYVSPVDGNPHTQPKRDNSAFQKAQEFKFSTPKAKLRGFRSFQSSLYCLRKIGSLVGGIPSFFADIPAAIATCVLGFGLAVAGAEYVTTSFSTMLSNSNQQVQLISGAPSCTIELRESDLRDDTAVASKPKQTISGHIKSAESRIRITLFMKNIEKTKYIALREPAVDQTTGRWKTQVLLPDPQEQYEIIVLGEPKIFFNYEDEVNLLPDVLSDAGCSKIFWLERD